MADDLYKVPTGAAYWARSGDASRVHVTAAMYTNLGNPPVLPCRPSDPFWGRVPNVWGEVFHKAGETQQWRLVGVSGVTSRKTVTSAEWAANGSPTDTELSALDVFWALPIA